MTIPATIKYTDQQLSAITMMKENRIGVMTGGPGTGKSTTIYAIIEWAMSCNLRIFQAAPTGRAAKRMTEATNRFASTIHTLLGCTFDQKEGFVFGYNKDNPLPCDLLIIDETSMITNNLMARLMEAVDVKRTRVLLVGDQDQLPSVGAGAILRDLLASEIVPRVELTVIHRNSGLIVKACDQIKNSRIYIPSKKIDLEKENPDNLIHISCSDPVKILENIKKIVCERMPLRGYDPVEDVQVLSPVNSKGLLSCDSINEVLQAELNPDRTEKDIKDCVPDINLFEQLEKKEALSGPESTKEKKKKVFRAGDKVINTKNEKVMKTDNFESAIVNGDIGIIQSVTDKKIIVLFSDPDREVILSKSTKTLLHAYCITCHKFQGSEAPVIIIPVHCQFNYFIDNPWIYTAISRGKELVITIGQFGTIEKAIRNRVPNNRYTMLKERIVSRYREIEFGDI